MSLLDILEAMQDDEPNEGFITYKNFHKEMIRILSLKLYPPASADLLMQAFRVIDTANLGFIDSEVIEKLLFTKGEAFRQQELDEFYSVSRNDETDRIMYEDYVSIACKGR